METLDYTWYQEAAYSTCTPECYIDAYLNPGYISEVGEFAGKIAKTIRGDDVQGEDIMLELGDCAWFIAIKARLHKHELIISKNMYTIPDTLDNISLLLQAHLKNYHQTLTFRLLKHICESLGFSFDEVLKMNIKKLESRQKRNIIQGNGDYR